MPVNMDPTKKRRRDQAQPRTSPLPEGAVEKLRTEFAEETEEDRQKALADAESKNLWDATEVIDMDKF